MTPEELTKLDAEWEAKLAEFGLSRRQLFGSEKGEHVKARCPHCGSPDFYKAGKDKAECAECGTVYTRRAKEKEEEGVTEDAETGHE